MGHLMGIQRDPEGNETRALLDMVDFHERTVLEVGCGDGRLTWQYASQAARVTGIDPDENAIAAARSSMPPELEGRLEFIHTSLEEFAGPSPARKYDLIIFSWSL